MRDYADGEIDSYISSGDAMDKAGAYAVQDPYFRPAGRVDGCHPNVVGLPLCELARMLKDAGVAVAPRPEWALPPQCAGCEERAKLCG
jgi:predicted house-cleaning NTP pyrophosphatase (Maf/HAM1 superfamily)